MPACTATIPADTSAADPARAGAFFDALWDRWVPTTVSNRVRKQGYRSLLRYFRGCSEGPEAAKRLTFTEDGILFTFDEPDRPLESAAAAHWAEVAFQTLPFNHTGFERFPAEFGIRIVRDDFDPEAVMSRQAPLPMVEIKRKIYGIQADPLRLIAPLDGLDIAGADLTEAARAEVDAVLSSGQCACQLCHYYRPRAAKWMAKRRARRAQE